MRFVVFICPLTLCRVLCDDTCGSVEDGLGADDDARTSVRMDCLSSDDGADGSLGAGVYQDSAADRSFYRTVFNCSTEVPGTEEHSCEDGPEHSDLSMIHVVYSSDRKSMLGILYSMLSLARNLLDPQQCTIHLIAASLDMDHTKQITECFTGELVRFGYTHVPSVVMHEMRPIRFDFGKFTQSFRRDLLEQPHTFVRFYIHEYLPAAPRALWLDHDTIVKADVGPLYRMRMTQPLAAAPEAYRTKGIFNTGVLVFNFSHWRSGVITQACEHFTIQSNGAGGEMVGMNSAFRALRLRVDDIVDWRWNVRGFSFGPVPQRCVREGKILHWAGGPDEVKKPWQIGTNQTERRIYRYDLFEPYIPQQACEVS